MAEEKLKNNENFTKKENIKKEGGRPKRQKQYLKNQI